MTKILGIDTGTNSLGWAIVEKQADNYNLLDKGVNIFQEGVKIEKGIESSKAAERTEQGYTCKILSHKIAQDTFASYFERQSFVSSSFTRRTFNMATKESISKE